MEFFLTVTIIAFAVEEAFTATTGMDRAEALGDVFFWLGVACTGFGVAPSGAGYIRGGISRGPFRSPALATLFYGLALVAFSIVVRG